MLSSGNAFLPLSMLDELDMFAQALQLACGVSQPGTHRANTTSSLGGKWVPQVPIR